MAIGNDGYYHSREILGYNCKVNFILSDRGRGKTFDLTHLMIGTEGTAMCLFLDSDDMEKAMMSWTNDLYDVYEPEAFSWGGTSNTPVLMYNGQEKVYFRYISAVRHIKHERFNQTDPDKVVNWIWIDEFITPSTNKMRGIKSVGDAIRLIMKTCDHDTTHPREERGLKPLRLILTGNPFTWNDPNGILDYFHVLPRGFGIHKVDTDIVYELLEPAEKKNKKRTLDDVLGDEINRNMSFMEEDAFVENMPKGCMPQMSLRMGEHYYTTYKDLRGIGKLWVKRAKSHRNVQGTFRNEKYGTEDGLKEDEYCLEAMKIMDNLKNMYYSGKLRFENINTKFAFLNDLERYR